MFTEIRIGRGEGYMRVINLNLVESLTGGQTDDEGNLKNALEFHMASGEVIPSPFMNYEKGVALLKLSGRWVDEANPRSPRAKEQPIS